MRLLSLIVLACVPACWGSSSDSGDPLAGTAWSGRVPGLKCDHQLTFDANGQYLESWVCTFPDYTQAAEVNVGTYGVDGQTLTVALTQSTCATDQSSGSVDFSLSGDTLTLISGGMVSLTRLGHEPGEPTSIPFGCFDNTTWAFTPGDIHPI